MPDSVARDLPVDPHRLEIDAETESLLERTNPGVSLSEAAVSGGLWTAMQLVVVKLASLTGTFVLIHLLSPDSYGVATLALSMCAMVTVLQPFTMGDVVLARSRDLDRISGTAHRITLITSALFALAILASGPWAAKHYRSAAMVAACSWVALRPLSDWLVMLPVTRLRTNLRFRVISTVDAIAMTGATLTSALMAWSKLGFVSLILPQIGFSVIRAVLYRRAAPAPPSPAWVSTEAPALFRKFMLSGLGQYVHGGLISITPLIIGTFTSQREVGWYTIAFTIAMQINVVVGFGMGVMLQPIFAQMADDPARQARAFTRACRVLATLAMPVCVLQAVLAPAAFRTLLPEKWAGAMVLTQILSLGQAFFFGVNPSIGFLAAQGRFRTFMLWQTLQFVVVVSAMLGVGFFWRAAPLIPMVLVAGLYHVISAPTGVWVAVRHRGVSLGACVGLFLRPLLVSAASVLLPAWLSSLLGHSRAVDVTTLILLPVVSLTIFVFLLRRFDASAAEDCARLMKSVLGRIRQLRSSRDGSLHEPAKSDTESHSA